MILKAIIYGYMNNLYSCHKRSTTMKKATIMYARWGSAWNASGQPPQKPKADTQPKVPATRHSDVRDAH